MIPTYLFQVRSQVICGDVWLGCGLLLAWCLGLGVHTGRFHTRVVLCEDRISPAPRPARVDPHVLRNLGHMLRAKQRYNRKARCMSCALCKHICWAYKCISATFPWGGARACMCVRKCAAPATHRVRALLAAVLECVPEVLKSIVLFVLNHLF